MIILITSKCRAVANYIIEKSNEYNEDRTFGKYEMMSCKRLQRLLYFCNVKYMLLQNGEFLFEDDFYAWPTGIVIPGIYYVYVPYLVGKSISRYEGKSFKLTGKEILIIDNVLEQTKDIATFDLIKISNNGLWERYYDKNDFEHN